MSSPRQRQLLLALVTAVTVGSTVLVATANAHRETPAKEAWVASWATAPTAAGAGKSKTGFTDQTIRMTMRTSVGGSKARIRISNRFGTQPLTVGHATVALPWAEAGPGDLKPGSIKDATFGGQKSVVIPVGGTAISDAVDTEIPWAGDVSISVYLPVATGPSTWHVYGKQTAYVGTGDHTAAASGANLPETRTNYYFVTGLDVLNRTGEGTIAVLGDSITDGFMTTTNANHRWTNYLAARLNKEAPGGNAPGMVNLGLTGNRLTADGADFGFPELGINASARFYPDVIAQPGIDTLILALGINDIWIGRRDANTIIAAMQQIAALAHQNGLRILVVTLTPWAGFESAPGAKTYTPELESVRLAVNSFIRTGTDFDGIIDFDMVLRNPADPSKLRPGWDSGDHIHPNDNGNEAMAAAVPLDLLLEDSDDDDANLSLGRGTGRTGNAPALAAGLAPDLVRTGRDDEEQ